MNTKLPEIKKKKTLFDIIHRSNENLLSETDEGLVVNDEIGETVEYFDEQLKRLINEQTGQINLSSIFTKLGSNLATKAVASDIMFQKIYALVMKRVTETPGSISDKDLFALMKFAGQETSNSTRDLKHILESVSQVKMIEEEEKKKSLKRDIALTGLDDQQIKRIGAVLSDINLELERSIKNGIESEPIKE